LFYAERKRKVKEKKKEEEEEEVERMANPTKKTPVMAFNSSDFLNPEAEVQNKQLVVVCIF